MPHCQTKSQEVIHSATSIVRLEQCIWNATRGLRSTRERGREAINNVKANDGYRGRGNHYHRRYVRQRADDRQTSIYRSVASHSTRDDRRRDRPRAARRPSRLRCATQVERPSVASTWPLREKENTARSTVRRIPPVALSPLLRSSSPTRPPVSRGGARERGRPFALARRLATEETRN